MTNNTIDERFLAAPTILLPQTLLIAKRSSIIHWCLRS